MEIHRGYKTELRPNNKQRTLFRKHCGIARYAYNWALNRVSTRTSKPNGMKLSKEWNAWKKENIPWWTETSKCAPQSALFDLEDAFKKFFSNCKKKKKGQHKGKPGYPQFKSKKDTKQSFSLTGAIHVESKRIKLPRIGWVRLKEKNYIPLNAHILSITVSHRADRWFISVQVKEEREPPEMQPEGVCGSDVGIKTLLTCSDGTTHGNPQPLRKELKRLKKKQRTHSRRGKCRECYLSDDPKIKKQHSCDHCEGKNRDKSRKAVANLHFHISEIREDYWHKITSYLTKTKLVNVIEDLCSSGMLKNHKLALSLSDCAFGEFKRQMKYKSVWNDTYLLLADRFYPSSKLCSCCGWKNKDLTLADRTFVCKECGLVLDRDLNAAKNLENYYYLFLLFLVKYSTVSSTETGCVVKSMTDAFGEASSDYMHAGVVNLASVN